MLLEPSLDRSLAPRELLASGLRMRFLPRAAHPEPHAKSRCRSALLSRNAVRIASIMRVVQQHRWASASLSWRGGSGAGAPCVAEVLACVKTIGAGTAEASLVAPVANAGVFVNNCGKGTGADIAVPAQPTLWR